MHVTPCTPHVSPMPTYAAYRPVAGTRPEQVGFRPQTRQLAARQNLHDAWAQMGRSGQELHPGFQGPVGENFIRVDLNGDLSVEVPTSCPKNARAECHLQWLSSECDGGIELLAKGFACNFGTSATAAKSGGQVRYHDGHLVAPNGSRLPLTTPGFIVDLPDGSQVAGGRTSSAAPNLVRQARAEPGAVIPLGEKGKTTRFQITPEGGLVPTGVV